jgi:hypothetical protein
MTLFQLFISGYTTVNGIQRIRCTGINPFRGKCRITFLNYGMVFTVGKTALIRVDSNELYNNMYDYRLILPIDGNQGISTSKSGFYWESDLVSPTITIDIVEANEPAGSPTPIPATTFAMGFFSFDIEELEQRK